MAEIGNKAAAALKNGGAKAKDSATKLYALVKDPAVQARIKGLADDGKKIYVAVTSPEAKRACPAGGGLHQKDSEKVASIPRQPSLARQYSSREIRTRSIGPGSCSPSASLPLKVAKAAPASVFTKGIALPLEIGLWRVTDKAVQLAPAKMPLESRLEQLILDDPAILETELLLIGHQVLTGHGKLIDILGIDLEGTVHIVELKRDRTPREIVAQALDYASWVQGLSNEDIRDIFNRHHPGTDFDIAFAERFGGTPTPDDLNEAHSITVVASDLDDSTERIVEYLSSTYAVPINVMLFRYFSDQGHDYLARTWLIPSTRQASASGKTQQRSSKAAWNGSDWYVAFGMENSTRSWNDAQKYGFVSAGGGEWYSRSLRKLPVGARIFVYVPGHGYVGVGTVTGPAVPALTAKLAENGNDMHFSQLDLQGDYGLHTTAVDDGTDTNEYIVPVSWEHTVSLSNAFWLKGLFANQNSACKLRHELTLTEVSKAFGLDSKV